MPSTPGMRTSIRTTSGEVSRQTRTASAPSAVPTTVAALTANQVPFSEVSAHRATLEEAYMELTRDAVEFRAAPAARGAAQ
jgi:ABC-2 type transport system ATP-binding protein